VPTELDALVLRGLDSNPEKRFRSAREMAIALERCVPPAPAMEVGEWVERTAYDLLEERRHHLAEIEHAVGPPRDPDSVSLPVSRRGSSAPDADPSAVDTRPESRARVDELSSISVARRAIQSARRRPARRLAIVLLALAALLGAAFVLWRVREWRSASLTTSSGPTTSTPSTGPSGDPSSTPSLATDPQILDLTPTADITGPVGMHGPSHPYVPPPGTKKSATASSSAAPTPSTAATGAGDDCIPPYTWDALGRRIYKRHCLKP
jgi:serine/threonine-protein kinase